MGCKRHWCQRIRFHSASVGTPLHALRQAQRTLNLSKCAMLATARSRQRNLTFLRSLPHAARIDCRPPRPRGPQLVPRTALSSRRNPRPKASSARSSTARNCAAFAPTRPTLLIAGMANCVCTVAANPRPVAFPAASATCAWVRSSKWVLRLPRCARGDRVFAHFAHPRNAHCSSGARAKGPGRNLAASHYVLGPGRLCRGCGARWRGALGGSRCRVWTWCAIGLMVAHGRASVRCALGGGGRSH